MAQRLGDMMGLFDRFRKKKQRPAKEDKIAQTKTKSDKDLATERGEPWIDIVNIDITAENLHEGSIEFDWNSIFITRLVKAGYMLKPDDTDVEIVERWWTNVCRHQVLETWEQEQAMNPTPQRHIQKRDIGGGRTEVS